MEARRAKRYNRQKESIAAVYFDGHFAGHSDIILLKPRCWQSSAPMFMNSNTLRIFLALGTFALASCFQSYYFASRADPLVNLNKDRIQRLSPDCGVLLFGHSHIRFGFSEHLINREWREKGEPYRIRNLALAPFSTAGVDSLLTHALRHCQTIDAVLIGIGTELTAEYHRSELATYNFPWLSRQLTESQWKNLGKLFHGMLRAHLGVGVFDFQEYSQLKDPPVRDSVLRAYMERDGEVSAELRSELVYRTPTKARRMERPARETHDLLYWAGLLRARRIPLIFVAPAATRQILKVLPPELSSIPFVNYHQAEKYPELFLPENRCDITHMEKKGAILASRHLARDLLPLLRREAKVAEK